MAKYNTKRSRSSEKTTTYEGGVGYKLKPEFELINLLANGIGKQFYETETEQTNRLKNAIDETVKSRGVEFVAKALVYARDVIGQRSVTHVGSVFLAPHLSGDPLGKYLFTKRVRHDNKGGVVYRIDDMLEIIACYMAKNPGKRLPNSMTKGFKMALESADTYELAKYQASSRGISLVDVVNLVHPKPKKSMEETFRLLMEGELKQFNTAEDKNSKAGQEVAEKVRKGEITKEEAEVELKEAKKDNWRDLLVSKKIGYLALLRNLRNIIKDSGSNSEEMDLAIELLVNEDFIRKSKVWPHQIDLALEILMSEFNVSGNMKLFQALNTAYELSVPNLEGEFHGRTAVVVDTSASMEGSSYNAVHMNRKSIGKAPIEKASLIGATFAKGVGADLFHFASTSERLTYNPMDSINTIKNVVKGVIGRCGHGTSMGQFFSLISNEHYDRIFVISDMQTDGYVKREVSRYADKHGHPHIYNIHLSGYGDTVLPKSDNKVYQLFGYGSDIYELAKKVETNPEELIDEINKIELV